jgi:hypothetical protein
LYTESSRHQHIGKEAPMRRGGSCIVGLILVIVVIILVLRALGII